MTKNDNTHRNLRGKKLEQYKKTLKLNEIQRDIIIGTLLGDSTMGLRKEKPVYALKFEQSSQRKNYVYHLAEEFQNFCGVTPKERLLDEKTERKAIGFRTYSHPSLRFYFKLFYVIEQDPVKGKLVSRKIVPKNIHKFLTARALAYWFMDDGTYHTSNSSKNYVFSTQAFTQTECEILVNALKTNFNINARIHKDKDKHRIYIKSISNNIFLELIRPYIHPDFMYKL